MTICIPVYQDMGLQSEVYPHFGSAPVFLLVDTETATCRAVVNQNEHHAHGMCAPLASLQGQDINGMVVGGIGMGALSKLAAANIQVYLAQHRTAGETLAAFKAGDLPLMRPEMACAHHGHGHH